MEGQIGKFIKDQLSVWPLAAENYRDLKKAEVKKLEVGGLEVKVQHNPCRRISSEAALDKKSFVLKTALQSSTTSNSRAGKGRCTASP